MDDKEIEQILRAKAKEVKVKDFSSRLNDISERLYQPQNESAKETCAESVLVAPSNSNITRISARKKLLYSLSAVCLLIILCLAIVLPITLKKNNEPKFFVINELTNITVTESEFYSEIEKSHLEIKDFSSTKFDLYVLAYSPDQELVGGKLEVINEDEGLFLSVYIYKQNVKHDYTVGADYECFETNNYNIEYKTDEVDGLYVTKAQTSKWQFDYYIDYVSLDENVESFFEEIFG